MDITSTTPTTTTTTTTTTTIKTPEAESETPTRIQPKTFSFSNGVLKRTQPLNHHHHHHHNSNILHHHHHAVVVIYKECLKNHAASMGGHAVDGCGEFMPSPNANPTDPTSLKCAACGCHRNFHRREPEDPPIPTPISASALEYQPHHRHHPPPPHRGGGGGGHSSPGSASPPPISSSYYPSAPHMLLALSTGLSAPPPTDNSTPIYAAAFTRGSANGGRKRFRTKFTQDQKDKMLEFAERVGWKMQKRDEDLICDFCNEIGVDKSVLKVWMHNNKSNLGKKDQNSNTINTTNLNNYASANGNGNGIAFGTAAAAATATTHYHHHDDGRNNDKSDNEQELSQHNLHSRVDSVSGHVLAANGGSSSSS